MSIIDTLVSQEQYERGLYGSMVAAQNELATMGGLYNVEDMDFERLDGPVENPWVDVEDLAASYDYRDEEVYVEEPNEHYFFEDQKIVMAFYFETVDALRKLTWEAKTVKDLDWIKMACETLDWVMQRDVVWWMPTKTTFQRIGNAFRKQNRYLRRMAENRAHMIEIGVITPRKEVVGVPS